MGTATTASYSSLLNVIEANLLFGINAYLKEVSAPGQADETSIVVSPLLEVSIEKPLAWLISISVEGSSCNCESLFLSVLQAIKKQKNRIKMLFFNGFVLFL